MIRPPFQIHSLGGRIEWKHTGEGGSRVMLSSPGGGREVDAAETAGGLAQTGGQQGPGVSGLNA